MKLYIAIWDGRRRDITAHPFTKKEDAVKWAKRTSEEYCRRQEDYEECNHTGLIYYASYSYEGDCIYVVEEELDGKLKEKENVES